MTADSALSKKNHDELLRVDRPDSVGRHFQHDR
jgi:hypothetical protein